MIAFRFSLPLAAALVLSSCGESFIEVVERHQPEMESFKGELIAIADAVPEKPGELPLSEPFDPPLKFVEDDLAASNTLITTVEQLADPAAEIDKDERLDLYYNEVKNLLIWSEWEDKAFDDYESDLQAALELRYVVVYQTVEFTAPSMLDEKTYDRGVVILEVHVYDREASRIVCSFPVMAQADEEVSFSYESGTSGVSEGLRAARSTLWSNAREAFLEALTEKTGGSFEK